MKSISLSLLVQGSLAMSIPVIENGMGENMLGPETMITDFAVLTVDNPVNIDSIAVSLFTNSETAATTL